MAVGDIQQGDTALPPALGSFGFDANNERLDRHSGKCHLAEFPDFSGKGLFEEGVEGGPVRPGNQIPQAAVDELGALDADKAGAGEIDGEDGSVAVEG